MAPRRRITLNFCVLLPHSWRPGVTQKDKVICLFPLCPSPPPGQCPPSWGRGKESGWDTAEGLWEGALLFSHLDLGFCKLEQTGTPLSGWIPEGEVTPPQHPPHHGRCRKGLSRWGGPASWILCLSPQGSGNSMIIFLCGVRCNGLWGVMGRSRKVVVV